MLQNPVLSISVCQIKPATKRSNHSGSFTDDGDLPRQMPVQHVDPGKHIRIFRTRYKTAQQQLRTDRRKSREKATNWPGFVSAAQEDAVVISLGNYPAFGQIHLTMCIGEQLTVLAEWVTPLLVFYLLLRYDRHGLMTAFLSPPPAPQQ